MISAIHPGAVYAPAIRLLGPAMDASSCALGALGGFLLGWWSRGVTVVKEAPLPCNCHCSCVHQGDSTHSGSSWFGFTVYLIICLVILLLVGVGSAAALVCKISYTQRGSEQELAISVKGKSKGVLNPKRALQITD